MLYRFFYGDLSPLSNGENLISMYGRKKKWLNYICYALKFEVLD